MVSTKEPILPWIEGKCKHITETPNVDVRCLNWATHHPDFCTIHDPSLKCCVEGCKGFKTNIAPVENLCYIHANQTHVKYIKVKEESVRFIHDVPHGSYLKYKQNCRCPKCKEAKKIYESIRRTRKSLLKVGDLTQARELEKDLKFMYYGEGALNVSHDSDVPFDRSEQDTGERGQEGPLSTSRAWPEIPPFDL